ncbi:MAG: PEP-CTERM sorting domain-containing protein [Phycisphaerae bacterium]
MRSHFGRFCSIAVVLTMVAGIAGAETLAANWCSVANVANPPAGVVPTLGWNDFTGPAGFSPTDSSSDPLYASGATATGVTVSWTTSDGGSQNTNDYVLRPSDIQDGHDEMMAGYLQASKYSSAEPVITLEVTGLNVQDFGGSYDVYVYFDGDDDVTGATSRAMFRIYDSKATFDGGGGPLLTYFGRDDGSDFAVDHTVAGDLSDYEQIVSTDEFNPTAGNYVQFSGLELDQFYVRIVGVAGQHGVAMNGFQVVREPTTMALLGLGGIAAIFRRRK